MIDQIIIEIHMIDHNITEDHMIDNIDNTNNHMIDTKNILMFLKVVNLINLIMLNLLETKQ